MGPDGGGKVTDVLDAIREAVLNAGIEAFDRAGIRGRVKVIVGGAPVDAGFAGKIGANGYAGDAGTAVNLVRRLLEPRGEPVGAGG